MLKIPDTLAGWWGPVMGTPARITTEEEDSSEELLPGEREERIPDRHPAVVPLTLGLEERAELIT